MTRMRAVAAGVMTAWCVALTCDVGFAQGGRERIVTTKPANSGCNRVDVPAASYAVRGPFVTPLTGGGIDDSSDAAAIFIGSARPSTDKSADGLQGVLAQFTIPASAPPLSVQSIAIRFEGSPQLIDRLLEEAKLTALDNLRR